MVETQQMHCKTIHQLDCVYHGEFNKSYQREGFGILQTLTFDTYAGFWKNNKAEGRGIIFYQSGVVIYGHFSRNQLDGPTIYDHAFHLKICFMQGNHKIGLAF